MLNLKSCWLVWLGSLANLCTLKFTASMWSREEALRIVAIAREVMPNLRTLSLPQGLQMDKGPDAVVEYVRERLPEVLGSR